MNERIMKIIANQLMVTNVELGDKTAEDLNMDSLDIVEMIMDIETEFDISITDEEYEKGDIYTVQDVINFVKGKVDVQ